MKRNRIRFKCKKCQKRAYHSVYGSKGFHFCVCSKCGNKLKRKNKIDNFLTIKDVIKKDGKSN